MIPVTTSPIFIDRRFQAAGERAIERAEGGARFAEIGLWMECGGPGLSPGEVAPAHRHAASALRFIIEGDDAFTAVDGEKTIMKEGDFVITPSWTWHDHGSDQGPSAMVKTAQTLGSVHKRNGPTPAINELPAPSCFYLFSVG